MYRILLLIGLFTSSLVFSASTICPENRCVAIIDAGNSGSRLHIYSYNLDGANTPYDIKNVFSKKIRPGFASVELNQNAINRYLSSLFADVPDLSIPVYFYATSGMRMLNFARQQAYYAKLNHWFSKQSQWKLVAAKTLKSREEALYGWLAVNYELGALTSPSVPLVGVVDTGSASVQVAFPLKNLQNVNPDDYIEVDIYERHVSLFTHGFLGLGQDEIRNQYLDNAVCFPTHYPLPNGSAGAGYFQSCEKLMEPLVNGIHQVNNTVASAIQDNSKQNWYVIGGISAMLQERPFTFEHDEFTHQDFSEKANRQVCQQDWSILGTLYPENKHLFTSCLNASYFYSLFVEGFGIDSTQPIHYISNKISANDWTLGAVLYQNKV
ncbi:MAG: multidrug DMT transporter permease [Gammaproteobacteria bacterium]|nr:multidrug DMT transporter permease [Gammaproteobacteria bacterium]